MNSFHFTRAIQATLIGIAMTGSATLARADVKDYEFQLVDQTVKKGDAIISVRLVHKPDGKPVPDAVIFATRLDMAPDGMPEMATKVAPMPRPEAGSSPSAPKCRARPGQLKTSSSLRRRRDPLGRNHPAYGHWSNRGNAVVVSGCGRRTAFARGDGGKRRRNRQASQSDGSGGFARVRRGGPQ